MRNQELTEKQIEKYKFVTEYLITQLTELIDDLERDSYYEEWRCETAHDKMVDIAAQYYGIIIDGEEREGQYPALDLYYDHIQDKEEEENDKNK
jgi:hypothetical protein